MERERRGASDEWTHGLHLVLPRVKGEALTPHSSVQDFSRLRVWQRAHELTLDVYRETTSMPQAERYGLTAQMRSAAVSIESNIAEGCGRSSRRDFARFLHHSTGSANELECQIRIAKDLGFVGADAAELLSDKRREVKQMLSALLARIRAYDRTHSRRQPAC
jgi:four helix bundle protein